ncbi:hypothetical protein CCB80_09965 [Armatimonadetes bacterium Uphvl-Ar1]|nr:hypothetical protein CCB80_09965 [Armatimonadetes bacterium Uphvl-Ar1]
MVVLVAHAHIKPESLPAYLELATAMLAPSQAEEPCITYEFFQHPTDPNHIVFVEEWTTRAGLQDHFEMPHFKEFVKATAALVESSNIRIYEVAGHEDL